MQRWQYKITWLLYMIGMMFAMAGCVAPDGSVIRWQQATDGSIVGWQVDSPVGAVSQAPGPIPTTHAASFPQRPILFFESGEGGGIKAVDLEGSVLRSMPVGILLGWSPQGDRFAYLPFGTEGLTGLVVATLEGEEELIFEFGANEQAINFVRQSVWSPDGRQIALLLSNDTGIQAVIVDADNGQVLTEFALTDIVNEIFSSYPAPDQILSAFYWSPDGRKLLLSLGDLLVLDVERGAVESVVSSRSIYWLNEQAQWLADSNSLIYFDGYVFHEDGTQLTMSPPQLWRKRLDDEDAAVLLTTEQLVEFGLDGSDQFALRLSPTGTKVALIGINNGNDEDVFAFTTLLIFDLAALQSESDDGYILQQPIAQWQLPGLVFSVEWGPDEQALAFFMASEKGTTIELLPWSEDTSHTLAEISVNEEIDVDNSIMPLIFLGINIVSWMP